MESKTLKSLPDVAGTLEVPGDKSISHRAVMLGALSNRVCKVQNFLRGEDCLCTLEAFRSMGIQIDDDSKTLQIHGQGLEGLHPPLKAINCGNSGTTTRLLMGVLTGQPFDVDLVGDASLSSRPMDRVMEPLTQMGAFFISKGSQPGKLPLRIHGTRSVRPITWKSPVASAQVKSAILLAGLYASGTTEVEEPSSSRDHTERMLKACSVQIRTEGSRVSVLGTATVRAVEFRIPGDLSSAAFFLAAGLLLASNEILIKGVGVNPTRIGFLDAVKTMGGTLRQQNATIWSGEPVADLAVKKSVLKAFTLSGEIIPRLIDEVPILALLATQATGRTEISDAKELRVKESDRLTTLREELSKMGARISEKPDGLIIEGPTPLKGAVVNSHGDHRLAMTLAIAALIARGSSTIEDVACVQTSFPTFWTLLDQLHVSH